MKISFKKEFIEKRNSLIKQYLTMQITDFDSFKEFISHLHESFGNGNVIHSLIKSNIQGVKINYPFTVLDNGHCIDSYEIDGVSYSYTDLVHYTNNLYTICSVNNTNSEYEEVVLHHNESNRRLNVMTFYLKNIVYEVNVIEIIL